MTPDEWPTLERELLGAHESGDGEALIGLYSVAADKAAASGGIDRSAFLLTHA